MSAESEIDPREACLQLIEQARQDAVSQRQMDLTELRLIRDLLDVQGPDAIRMLALLFVSAGKWKWPELACTAAIIVLENPEFIRLHSDVLRASDDMIHVYQALNTLAESVCFRILALVERLGDQRALPHVSRLAESTSDEYASRELRQAAADCLEILRIEREKQVLLRPSDAPESLLRPASAVDSDPDRLLRPT